MAPVTTLTKWEQAADPDGRAERARQAVADATASALKDTKDLDLWSQCLEVTRRELAALDRLDAEELLATNGEPAEQPTPGWRAALDEALTRAPALPTPDLAAAEQVVKDALSKPHQGPLVAQVTCGVGKSYQAALMAAASPTPVMLTTRSSALVAEAADRVRQAPPAAATPEHLKAKTTGSMAFAGRHCPDEETQRLIADARRDGEDLSSLPMPYGTCHVMSAVSELSEDRQFPGGSICMPSCPHHAAALWRDAPPGPSGAAQRSSAEQTLTAAGVSRWDTTCCGYTPQTEAARSTRVVIAHHAAGTETLRESKDGLRKVIEDETPPLENRAVTSARDMLEWEEAQSETLAWLLDRLDQCEDDDERAQLEAGIATVEEHTADLAAQTDFLRAEMRKPEPDLAAINAACVRLGEAAAIANGKKAIPNTAKWETSRVEWYKLIAKVDSRLRSTRALALSGKHGLVKVERHKIPDQKRIETRLVAWEPTPAGQRVLTGTSEILDATPSLALCSAAEAVGGEVVRAVVPQPVTVLVDDSHLMGRGVKSRQAIRTKYAVQIILERRDWMAEELHVAPEAIAILTYLLWTKALIEAGVPKEMVGWWGGGERGERGQNAWEHAAGLLIAGSPTLPDVAARCEYESDRAFVVMAGVNPDDWPEHDDKRELNPQVTVGGETVTWPGGLPANQHIRRWELDRQRSKYVQAISRLRAVRYPGKLVLILGAVPDLSEDGLTTTRVHSSEPIVLAATPKDRGRAWKAETDLRVATAMRDSGLRSERKLDTWLKENTDGKHGGNGRAVRRVKARLDGGQTLESIIATCTRIVAEAEAAGVIHKLRDDQTTSGKAALDAARREIRRAQRAEQTRAHHPREQAVDGDRAQASSVTVGRAPPTPA